VEGFTEFEQRGAYFDGDPLQAQARESTSWSAGSQVHSMSEFQSILDFPPAPKLTVLGRLDPDQSTEAERRGEALFFGKAQCATCRTPPCYTDNLMHNLRTGRFSNEVMINGRKASADGPIKTFPLRGITDSPPYLHDDRLLTLG
jgi:cytochrome c peroxidase